MSKPVKFYAIDHHPEIVRIENGRMMADAAVTLDKEDVERIKQGYVCIKCYEAHAHAWPEQCDVCGFPMRASQRDHMKNDLLGPRHVGPSKPLDHYIEQRQELNERKKMYEDLSVRELHDKKDKLDAEAKKVMDE